MKYLVWTRNLKQNVLLSMNFYYEKQNKYQKTERKNKDTLHVEVELKIKKIPTEV